jgi:DnaJ-class molecular chaperone
VDEACPFCDGSGDRDDDLCIDCAGTGLLHVDDADHADYAAPVNHDYRLPEQGKR